MTGVTEGWRYTDGLNKKVAALHRANPSWGATMIAAELGCHDAYVRSTARRLGLSLPRSQYGAVVSCGALYMRKRRADHCAPPADAA